MKKSKSKRGLDANSIDFYNDDPENLGLKSSFVKQKSRKGSITGSIMALGSPSKIKDSSLDNTASDGSSSGSGSSG